MPLVVRQALADRLSALPDLRAFLADVSLLAGVAVRFWPAVASAAGPAAVDSGRASAPEPVEFCARLGREAAGCRACAAFRQKLRERASAAPAEATCDAGLVEVLVPVAVGGVLAGHFLVAGLREGAETAKTTNRARHLLARQGVDWSAAYIARWRTAAPECGAARRAALARVLAAGAERVGRAMTEHLAGASPGVPDLVERAYRIVHAEHARSLRVPLLASRLGVSAAHLSRVFHHATGLRLVDYVARYRAERARAMLAEDDPRPVAEVARACGFASISQFNRVFRSTFGASPRALRRRNGRRA
ncbi:MAG: AraC family transcriptional regulator [Opitutaceae bacterium]|nr:AraC family transcriptional regulator [Opitutaceae bacterium]